MPEEFATKSDIANMMERLERRIERSEALLLERIEQLRAETSERIEQGVMRSYERSERVKTTLLKEFRKWAISFESKHRANEALVVGFSERVTSLEERVSDLERK